MTTGEKLQNLRKENNYTQEELADILSVSRQSISKWESDVAFPETDKLITLSKLFHCTVDYLLNVENDDPHVKSSLINEEPINKINNRSGLPFLIINLITQVLVLILFFCPWYRALIRVSDSRAVFLNINYYQMAFFLVEIENENQFASNLFALISLLTIIASITLSIVSLFIKNKNIKITIRVLNIVIPLLVLLSMLFNHLEWLITFLFVDVIYLALIICQFAVKPLRK